MPGGAIGPVSGGGNVFKTGLFPRHYRESTAFGQLAKTSTENGWLAKKSETSTKPSHRTSTSPHQPSTPSDHPSESSNKALTTVWAFILVTSLFFLWGFAYGLLDVLNKHFRQCERAR